MDNHKVIEWYLEFFWNLLLMLSEGLDDGEGIEVILEYISKEVKG